MKVEIKNLKSELAEPIGVFICTASFEGRCLKILEQVSAICERIILLKNVQAGPLAEANFKKMQDISNEKSVAIEIDLDDPLATARSLALVVDHISSVSLGRTFVDITTFTHEQLLILYKILEQSKPVKKVIFGYTGADRYSVNTSPDDAWLSRGISQLRSVLGFPGNFLPSKKLHLILMVGFEHERAKAVIEKFEPNVLTLGIGGRGQSVSEEHFETNRRFAEDVKKFVARRTSVASNVQTFQFSCVDPDSTKASVLKIIEMHPDHNTVICPMNTKLSTLGVARAASENTNIQVCYSRAIEYNESGYSTASDQVTFWDLLLE